MGATCCWTTSLINNWCCWPCDFKFSGAWKRKAWVEEKMVVGTRNQNETRGWSAPSVWGSRTSKIGGWTNSLGRISCWSWALKITVWAGIDETSFRGCKTQPNHVNADGILCRFVGRSRDFSTRATLIPLFRWRPQQRTRTIERVYFASTHYTTCTTTT